MESKFVEGQKTLLVVFNSENEITQKHYFVGDHKIKVWYEEDLMLKFDQPAVNEIQNLISDINSTIEKIST